MEKNRPGLLEDVARYYSAKLAEHGETPRGVDWNGEESQRRRFEQLCKLIEAPNDFSINDVGCGYGALCDYLKEHFGAFRYHGIDVSEDMTEAGRRRFAGTPNVAFTTAARPDQVADFGVASGIFNVRMGRGDLEWTDYLRDTLDVLNETSRRGFGFNCLTSYSDPEKMRDELYYADPCVLFDLCKRRYSRHVALLHDYGLYEFTILVRNDK
ncbi:SAM-dependent methyltransferase [Bordetella sp. H567]|uniref:class I SAM-dependent methyltransferase n=1 Tax=Bordetella sp. H567 TaxID=1697043 RepID=UPI00081CC9E6|nr:class I SAM-dependent methyltransferase [Bordetella sp. H567]AOB33091.1 SAM-dependent methyltransferase [Bordetella sp. H567]